MDEVVQLHRHALSPEGWLYVAAVIDLFSRCVVGWPMNTNMTAALIMAIWRGGKPNAFLHQIGRARS